MTRICRSRALFSVLACLAALAGCGGMSEPHDGPHVLLITLDSCRADHLGNHGHPGRTSPFLDALAREGTVYTHAFTSTAGTTASHTTILSGLFQETHRVALNVKAERRERTEVPYGLLLLPVTLQQYGYHALAVTDGGNVSRAFGFSGAFDDFDDQGGGVETGTRKLLHLVERAIRRSRPLVVWYQTYEIHAPYPAREGDGKPADGAGSGFEPSVENLLARTGSAGTSRGSGVGLSEAELRLTRARYESGIRYTDRQLQQLFAGLRRTGFLDSCVVVLTAPHGAEFGEHGGFLHRELLYEELIRVPLIFWGRGVPSGAVRHELTGTADIVPTLFSLIGIPVPELMNGRDLFGGSNARAGSVAFIQQGDEHYAVRTPQRKLIENPRRGRQELYDLYRDPGEQEDLIQYYPHAARPLHDRLEQWRTAYFSTGMVDREAARLNREQRARLRDLGDQGFADTEDGE